MLEYLLVGIARVDIVGLQLFTDGGQLSQFLVLVIHPLGLDGSFRFHVTSKSGHTPQFGGDDVPLGQRPQYE